jgi:hypothetical protein
MIISCGMDTWLDLVWRFDQAQSIPLLSLTLCAKSSSEDGSQSFISEAFPPGTYVKPVQQGEFLGFQGDWTGYVSYGVGLHVHFSIVTSEADGSFRNEEMDVKIDNLPARPIQCSE